MQHNMLRFYQHQPSQVLFKHWANVVEDAKQLLSSHIDSHFSERYFLGTQEFVNPSAGVVYDFFSEFDVMLLDVRKRSDRVSGFGVDDTYFHTSYTPHSPGRINFTLFTRSQDLLEDVVSRFADDSPHQTRRDISVYANEVKVDQEVGYQVYTPLTLLC